MDRRDRTAGQAEHDLDTGVDEHVDDQVRTAELHRLCRRHFVELAGLLDLELARGRVRRDRGDERLDVERLRHHAARSRGAGDVFEVRRDHRGREHDVDIASLGVCLDPAARFDAIEARHEHVHHDQVGFREADLQHRVDSVVCEPRIDQLLTPQHPLHRPEL